MRMILVTICFALAGCNGAPLFTMQAGDGGGSVAQVDGGSDGGVVSGAPPTGAYRVTVTPTVDDCTPQVQPPRDPTIVFVHASLTGADSFTADWPGSSFVPGQTLIVSGFTLAPDAVEMDESINGATLASTFFLQSRDSLGFSVTQSQAWTQVADASAPSPWLPSSDCNYRATLRYDLVLPCPAPCVLSATQDPESQSCTCAQ